MKPIQNNDPASSTTQGPGVTSPESGKASGDTGTRKVDSVPDSEVTREISKAEDHRETKSEVLDGAQPAEGKSVVGANSDGSAEAQLNAILSDDVLAKCYKSQAKDTYFYASEHAFTKLQSMMENVGSDDPKKMAKEFEQALKAVKQDLKRFERDASDLKVTVTTQNSGPVQLIPFKLKEIDPDLLKELLKKALALTKNAMAQRESDPDYRPEDVYKGKISSCWNQIHPLLQQVDEKAKATFESSFKLLQFPRVEMHFDASAFRQVEKSQAHSSSPASTQSGQLEIENTGGFYNEKEPAEEAEENPENLSPDELYRQKILKNAQLAYREQFKRNGTEADADQAITKLASVTDEMKQLHSGVPLSSFGGSSSQNTEAPVQAKKPNVSEVTVEASQAKDTEEPIQADIPPVGIVPPPPKLGPDEILLFEGPENKDTSLEAMDEKQRLLFSDRKLWLYLEPEEVGYIALHADGLKKLIPDDVFTQTPKVKQKSDVPDASRNPLPTLGDIAKRFWADPRKDTYQVQPKEEHPKDSSPDTRAVLVSDKPQISPIGTDILVMSSAQQRLFRKNELWKYMEPEQVVKLYSTHRGLVTTDGYNEVKSRAGISLTDASKSDIVLPTLEELLARHKEAQEPIPQLSLFRGSNSEQPLNMMTKQQMDFFNEKKLWQYLESSEIRMIDNVPDVGSNFKHLIPDNVFEEARNAKAGSSQGIRKMRTPTIGELADRYAQAQSRSEEPTGGNQDVQAVIKGDQAPSLPPGLEGFDQWADDQEKK